MNTGDTYRVAKKLYRVYNITDYGLVCFGRINSSGEYLAINRANTFSLPMDQVINYIKLQVIEKES